MINPRGILRPLAVSLAVGVVCALLYLAGALNSWSERATDRLFLARSPEKKLVVVSIDDTSIVQLGRWPWPRRIHAEIIDKLKEAGAKVIAYDVNFPEKSEPEADDVALAKSIQDAGNVVLPIELKLLAENGSLTFDPRETLLSIAPILSAAKSTGHSNTPPDSDGIVRRIPLSISGKGTSAPVPAFAAEAARLAGFGVPIDSAPRDGIGRIRINYPGSPFRSFNTISAVDLLRGRADLSLIKDSAVFVGSTAADLHDAFIVPTSGGVPMPGVEIHASLFDALAGSHWLISVAGWIMFLLIVLFCLIVGLLVSATRARISLPVVAVLWIAFLVASFLLFDRGLILDLVWPTLAFIFTYAGVTAERRISADRERRRMKTAFSRYVSSSVVDMMVKDPSKLKLGGERKRMSVLFSDIRGFTSIAEGLTPEKLVEILNRYLDRMTSTVFDNQGVLDKYIGDAVMAFWNAPFDQTDHAKRAVRTALAMSEALAAMNANKEFDGLVLKIGIGVNTGDMVVGNIGGESRFDYTVIGDNVNLASRLESLTKEYGVGIIVTQATLDDLAGEVLARRLDKVAVKGKKEPVVIYEVMSFASKATPDMTRLAQDFESALELYWSKDFAGALGICDQILKARPDDGPSKLLRERSQHFVESPPPADWNGTWVYTKK